MERMSSKVKGPVDVSERIKDTKQEIAHLSAELQKLITSNVKKSDKLEDDLYMQARHSLTHIDNSKINVATSDKQVDKPLHFLPESNLPKNSHTGCCSNNMCREKTEEVESPPKIRTYSRDEAREFIKKQREKRTKQLKLQSSENKNNIDLKKQKLIELRQKSLEIVARNVQSKRARSKSRERSEVRLDRSNAPTVRLRGSSVDRMSVGTNNKISTSCGDLNNSQSNINLANRTYRAMTKLEDKEKLTRPSRMKSNSHILNKNLLKPPMHPIEHFNIPVNRQASDLIIKDAPIVKHPIRLKNITLRTENLEEYSNHTTVQDQNDAAIKIQALYKGYRERKQLKENMSKMTKPTENKSSHSRETKETQTNLEQQMPIWLQPSNVVPYPCNFINTVKRKLQHVVNSPKICRDIGIQSSIIDQLQEDHQANKKDNNEFLAKGMKSNRSDPRSLLSHKCLNLDPGGVEHLELISNRINKVTVMKRARKRNDSESDTSKNIPDISSESGTSLKNNAADVKSCSPNGEEIKNGKGVANLQINSDKLRRLKLKSPSLLSIKTAISDSNKISETGSNKYSDVFSDVKSEASNNKKSDSRLKTSSEISENLNSPQKTKTNKNGASKYSYTFDFCGNEPETYESPASLNSMDLHNNEDTVSAKKGSIHSPRDSIISYNCSEYSQKSLKTPENNLVSTRSNKSKGSKKSPSSGKKSVITSETCTKSTEKLSHSPRESIISSNCSNYNNQSSEKNSPKNFEATPTFPHSNKLRPPRGVTVRETSVENCTSDLNIIQNIENSIDTSLVSHISDNGSISSQTTGKSKNSKFYLSPLSAILPEQIKHSSALNIYSNTSPLTNNSKSNDLVNGLNKCNVIDKLNSGSEEKPVPSEESQTVIDTQISETLNTIHSALNSSSSKRSLEHLDSSKLAEYASETSKRPVSFKSLYSSDPSSLKMDNISSENRSRATEPMEILLQPTVSLSTNNNVKCQENNRKLVSRALPTTKNCINLKDNSKEIHLKFEAEVHLLNDFNESMKQFMAVEKTFETIKNKNARNVPPVKILQNQDTQTSMVQRSINEKISKPTEHTTSIISTINYSRGSEFDTTGISIDNIDSTMLSTGLEISNINNTTNEQIELTKFDPENFSSKNFAGLSLKMFDQLLTDEDVRIENLKTIIKIREQALLDRTKGELAWLEIQRKHFKETGKIHEASLVKKKQRGILIKHQQERHEMQRLKQMQKVASHERKIVLKEQRNLIKAQLSTNKMLSKMKMNTPRKQKQLGPLKVLQTSESILSETSISRKDSAGEEIFTVTSHSIINRMSEVESDSATVDNKKMFKVPAQDRQISEIQRVLLVRQAALQKRRKDVEDLLKWNQKLLDEEKKIAELEMTANAIISQMPSVNKQDNSETSPKKHKFQGSQLNQLWKKMTGLDERKFEPSKVYTLSQTSLERFCRDARNYAIKNKNSTPYLENLSSINSNCSKDLTSDASISDIPSRQSFNASQVSENLRIPSEKSSAIDLHYSSDFEDSSLSAKGDVANKKITSISELIEDFTKIKNEISSLGLKTDENYISEDIQKSSSTSATSDSQKKSSVIETNKISSRIANGTSSLGNQNLNTNSHTDAISEAIEDLIVNEESAVSEHVKSCETTTMEEAIEEVEEAAWVNQNTVSSELVSLDAATLDHEVSMKHVKNVIASEINLEPIEDQIDEESDASDSKTSEGVEEIPSVENVEEPFITENKDYTSVDNTSLSEDIEHGNITHIPKTSEIEGITNSGVHQITTETGNNVADRSISEEIPADEPIVSAGPEVGLKEQSPSDSLQIDHVLSCGIIVRKRFVKNKLEAKAPEVHKNDIPTTPKKSSEALDDEKNKTETASVEIKTTTDLSEVTERNSATSNFDLRDMFGNEKDKSSDNTPKLTIPEERPLSAVETSELLEVDGSQAVTTDREKSNSSESGESASETTITSSLTTEDIDEESFNLPSSKLLVESGTSTSNLGMVDLFGDRKDISGTDIASNEKIQTDLSFKSGETISEAQKPTFEQVEEVADTVQTTSPTESKTSKVDVSNTFDDEDDFEKSSVSSRMEIYGVHLKKVHLSSDTEELETGDSITTSKVSEHSLASSETKVQIEKVSLPPDVSSSSGGKIPRNKESKLSRKIDELPEKESSSSAGKSGSSENIATKSNASGTLGSSLKDKMRGELSEKVSLSPDGRSSASEIITGIEECKTSRTSSKRKMNDHPEIIAPSSVQSRSSEKILEIKDFDAKSNESGTSGSSSKNNIRGEVSEKVSLTPDSASEIISGTKEFKTSRTSSTKKIDELPEKESSSSAVKSGSSENIATKSNESGTLGSSSKHKMRGELSEKVSLTPDGRSSAREIISGTEECKTSRTSSKKKIDDHPEIIASSAVQSSSNEKILDIKDIDTKCNESTSLTSSKKKILDERSEKIIASSPDVTSNGEKMSVTKESKSSLIASKKDIHEVPENKSSSAVESNSSEKIMEIKDMAAKSNESETSLTSSNEKIQDEVSIKVSLSLEMCSNSGENISQTKESKTSRTSSKKKLNDLEKVPSSAGKTSSGENVLPIKDSATKSNESIISLAPSKKEVQDGVSEKVAILKSREDILETKESSMHNEGTDDLVEQPSTEFTFKDVEELLEISELQKSRIYNEVVHVPSKRSTSKKIPPKAEDILRQHKDGSKNNDSESTSADVSSIHSLPSEFEKDLFKPKSYDDNDVDKSIENNNLLKNAIKSLEDNTASGREKIIEDEPNHADAISPKKSSVASEINFDNRSEKIELSRTDDGSLQENVENKPTDIPSALSSQKPIADDCRNRSSPIRDENVIDAFSHDAGSILAETSNISPVLSKIDAESAIVEDQNESSHSVGDLSSKESSIRGGANFHRRSEKVTGESKTDDKHAEIDDSTSRKLASVIQSLKSVGSSTRTSQDADEDLEDGGSNATSEKPISLRHFDENVTDDKDIGDVNCKRDDNKTSVMGIMNQFEESSANLLSKESNTGLENEERSKLTMSKSEDSSNMYLEDFEEDKSNLTTEVSTKQTFDSQNVSISTASQSDNGSCLNDSEEISVIAIEKNVASQLKDDEERSEKFVISSGEDPLSPKDKSAFSDKEEIGMSEKSADMDASGDVAVATDARDVENSVSASGDAQSVTIASKAEFRKKKAIDIRKRVSEILASTVDTSKNDKSPRSQDYYVTTYEDPVPTNSHDSESPVNNTQLYAVNNIFGNEAQELLKKQLAIEQEIKQLVQQQKEQIPFVFMREIPNKPPPPYTPPSSNQNSITPSLIPYEVEDLDNMTNYASKVLYNAYLSNNLEGVKFSEPDFKIISKTSSSKECCLFVFDLCKEVSKIHYKQFEKEKGPSWLRIQKRSKVASTKPFSYQELQKYITRKVRELLGFEKPCIKENAIMKWSRKRKDHVDEILVLESQAEEAEWINYDRDELLVKDEVTNEILNILLAETATMFNDILARKTFLS